MEQGFYIHIAAFQGHLEVVRFLVEPGANKNQGRRDDGAAPLHVAAHRTETALKLSDFWLSLAPTKTKARTMDQRLFFDCCSSRLP